MEAVPRTVRGTALGSGQAVFAMTPSHSLPTHSHSTHSPSMTPHSTHPTHSPALLPEGCAVPRFEPLRVRGGRQRLRRALARRRRAPAAILTMAAAALAVAGGSGEVSPDPPPHPVVKEQRRAAPVRLVSAPVRIADAATVRLLRPGDRVDVIAAPNSSMGGGGTARVVATGARVAEIPPVGETRPDGGALVVLSVPRTAATALAGAGVTSQLAVTLY
ncbi:hypothetical protein [Streptomyces lateritius]|uniref:hypothetical protein n=1 Tax=Streptomyces lateritius TaxID=67313 RepID=UPI0019BE1095|nr:hypothetical protein [Streptomyces lateritius]GGU13483.1 hypothetical protein GCM10010272_68250 [Streptomyces lateritius]